MFGGVDLFLTLHCRSNGSLRFKRRQMLKCNCLRIERIKIKDFPQLTMTSTFYLKGKRIVFLSLGIVFVYHGNKSPRK